MGAASGLVLLAASLPATAASSSVGDLAAALLVLLGLPALTALPTPFLPMSGAPRPADVGLLAAPSLYVLALHWSLAAAVRRGDAARRLSAGGEDVGLFVVDQLRATRRRRAWPSVAGAGVGVTCWLAWCEVAGAVEQVPGLSQDQQWHPLVQAGAMVTALVLAVALAGATRSAGAPLGVGAGLWLAHTVWAATQDSALWGFASSLAFMAAAAVAGLALSLSCAWGFIRSPSARA